EDLHWADASTRDFLTFLVRSARSERLCLVATYRSDELHRRHPLRPVLSELERVPGVERIALERFALDEVAELVAGILDGPGEPGGARARPVAARRAAGRQRRRRAGHALPRRARPPARARRVGRGRPGGRARLRLPRGDAPPGARGRDLAAGAGRRRARRPAA